MPTMDFPQQLREVALQVTRPRLAVLGVLAQHPHADASGVMHVRSDLPGVSSQAVYDCLNALTDAGLVRRIQPASSAARYELRVGDNHHHLVCRGCGCVVDVECALGRHPAWTPASTTDSPLTKPE